MDGGAARKLAEVSVLLLSFVHFHFFSVVLMCWFREWCVIWFTHIAHVKCDRRRRTHECLHSYEAVCLCNGCECGVWACWEDGRSSHEMANYYFIRFTPKTIHHSALDNGNVDWHVTQFLFPSRYTAEHEARTSSPRACCAQTPNVGLQQQRWSAEIVER